MKNVIILVFVCFFISACNNDKNVANHEKTEKVKLTKKVNSPPEILKKADINKDGKIDGKDWIGLSRNEKYELVNIYINITYKSLNISPPKPEKEKEVNRMVSRLNSYYTDYFFLKSAFFPFANRKISVYDAMLAVK